ncbi:MAG: hypothetical protein ACPLRN_00605 [Microgenomates group bacterium]
MDDFFRFISKVVIITPIVIVILALILKFNQNQKNNYQVTPTIFITPIPKNILLPTPIIDKKENKIGINLKDHWLCQYQLAKNFYKLEINKGKIILEATENGQYQKYDLTPYSFMIESMLNMDINELEKMASSYLPKGVSLRSILDSCKKL